MDEFKVTLLPPQSRGETSFKDGAAAQRWASELPLTNTEVVSSMLVSALQEINQSNLETTKRFEVLEVLRSLTRAANENLEKNYLRSMLPMSSRARGAFESGSRILSEMAQAYIILVEDIIKSGHQGATQRLLPYALYHAISYLARLLVSHYVVFAPEPMGVWKTLHRLYIQAKAREMEVLKLKIMRKRGDTRERSIDKAYKRVLLVSQATPYHLMQGEVNVIYNLMEEWSVKCVLIPISRGESLRQVLIIDSAGDAGPRYLLKDGSIPMPKHGWVFKCDGVRQIMNKKIREFLSPTASTDGTKQGLRARLERDMYFRLSDAWAIRRERVHERTLESEQRDVVVGLSAFHFVASNGEAFSPERAEMLIKSSGEDEGGLSVSGLELVSEEDLSWKVEEEISDAEAGVAAVRVSDFREKVNAWDSSAYAGQAHRLEMRDQQAEMTASAYQVRTCDQMDKSEGGLRLHARSDTGVELKVGEIIGLRYQCENQKDLWRLASVRWVKSKGENALDFGVRFISDEAKPMAARGIKGAGEGGEFIRVLIVSERVQNKRELSLLTPAAVYDLDSEVLINNGEELRTVKLTSLIETTNTFSRFRFEVVETAGS